MEHRKETNLGRTVAGVGSRERRRAAGKEAVERMEGVDMGG